MRPIFLLVVLPLLLVAQSSWGQSAFSLIDPETGEDTWSFNNGAEFPGATGSLTLGDDEILELVGDFTEGGGYVQAGRRLPDLEVRELSLWVKAPGTEKFTLRLGDATGQTHQIVLKCDPGEDWQQIVLPLEEFFNRRGQSDAVTSIARYESWGGAGDGKWHGPARGLYLLLSKGEANSVRSLSLRDIEITSPPVPVPGADVEKTLLLSELTDGHHEWNFSNGPEYPGATGNLTVQDEALKLSGDFTEGGGYVRAIRSLSSDIESPLRSVRFIAKSSDAKSITLQLIDGTGQTHQKRGFPITADGQWHQIEILPDAFVGGEHWGGANDGQWHGGLQRLSISLTKSSHESRQPSIELREISAEVVVPTFAQPAAFEVTFAEALDPEWALSDGVEVVDESLKLSRTLENVNRPISAVSPSFPVSSGKWKIDLATSSKLFSPDSSYNGVVTLEIMDASGESIDRFTIVDQYGEHDWATTSQILELPKGAAKARFRAQLNKTYGEFGIDSISAAFLAPATERDDRVSRLLFSTSQLGNLLFPEDPRTVEITVIASKPLRNDQRTISWRLFDYWGAEQSILATTTLGEAVEKEGDYHYPATIDLADSSLEIGRYYEIHAELPVGDGVFENYTSLAILPEAVTRQYPPEEVPFTSRNWDNRITEYIRLTDRLGIRICGIWGRWSSEPPYEAKAPGLDLCEELGMGWLTTTPIATIERGDDSYDETALREGVRNLIENFGHVRPMIINLGNEPHGTGEQVTKNVAAYRAVYEAVKETDPTIPVVATSVEPNEEYFRKGYAQWCDAYDFHIYESSERVRKNMVEYRSLAEAYGQEKPIWSTELGLNSQGQPRHRVAVEVFKKFASFFAEGGERVSWFGLLYPDREGKQHGTSGDSHNVFDCRFNRYAPRLDAIAYYNAVNAIAVKKFITEHEYENGTNAFLFQDQEKNTLQILWNEREATDIFLPLSGVNEVDLIRVDGTRIALDAMSEGLTLSVGDAPVLLLYKDEASELPASLLPPRGAFAERLLTAEPGSPLEIEIESEMEVELFAPKFWKVARDGNRFILTPPVESEIREIDLKVRLHDLENRTQGMLFHRVPLN